MLKPLPVEPFETGRWFIPRVDRFSQMSVCGNTYSVPVHFIGRQLRVLPHANELIVYDGRTVITWHERIGGRNGSCLVLDHYLEVLMHKPGAFPGATALEQARSAGRFTPATGMSSPRSSRDGTRTVLRACARSPRTTSSGPSPPASGRRPARSTSSCGTSSGPSDKRA
ncbi:hypothetical protein AB0L85_29535 [Streptomyces sp. NPDC052051]|uniref:Mu transposase domain-containing protein n=1 Tax=Streptomyces sp. NPDC052051 TaxID=3154649 RepID=UPI00342A06B0